MQKYIKSTLHESRAPWRKKLLAKRQKNEKQKRGERVGNGERERSKGENIRTRVTADENSFLKEKCPNGEALSVNTQAQQRWLFQTMTGLFG